MTTIQTIATLANVSKSTVSNAFNNPEALSPETRKHIFNLCRKHNYRREFFENIPKEKTETIIEFNHYCPQTMTDFSQRILKGVIEEAQKQGVKILITSRDSYMKIQPHDSKKITGRIIVHPTIKDQYQRSIPTVLIGNTQRKISYLSQVNNRMDSLIQEATELLISLDHRNILFLNSDKIQTISHQYLWGFKQTLQKHNILFSNTNHFMVPHQINNSEHVANLFQTKPFILDNITAIIIAETQMANGVYQAMEALNLKIPEDISIISLSKNRSISHLEPKLSYFDLNPEILGQNALQEVIRLIQGHTVQNINIDHNFMSQESVSYAKNFVTI